MPATTVILPTEIFSLDRHESYAHERFAYDILRIAVPALRVAHMPDNIVVHLASESSPLGLWTFDVWITPTSGRFSADADFEVHATAASPAIVLGICHHFAEGLFDERRRRHWREHIEEFRQHVIAFGLCLCHAAETWRRSGFEPGLRTFYEGVDLGLGDLQPAMHSFDLVAQFIGNHEVAHAYTRQLNRPADQLGKSDGRACEVLADLVATEWLYNMMVRNTPDTAEYREMRGFKTHSQSILSNAEAVVESQVLMFLTLAISSAIDGDGSVTLDGGSSHPNTFLRYSLQQIQFTTLVLSNQSQHVSEADLAPVDAMWSECLELFMSSGLVSTTDVLASFEQGCWADLARATELVGQLGVKELETAVPILRKLAEEIPETAKRRLRANSAS